MGRWGRSDPCVQDTTQPHTILIPKLKVDQTQVESFRLKRKYQKSNF